MCKLTRVQQERQLTIMYLPTLFIFLCLTNIYVSIGRDVRDFHDSMSFHNNTHIREDGLNWVRNTSSDGYFKNNTRLGTIKYISSAIPLPTPAACVIYSERSGIKLHKIWIGVTFGVIAFCIVLFAGLFWCCRYQRIPHVFTM